MVNHDACLSQHTDCYISFQKKNIDILRQSSYGLDLSVNGVAYVSDVFAFWKLSQSEEFLVFNAQFAYEGRRFWVELS